MKVRHLIIIDGIIWLTAGLNVMDIGFTMWRELENITFGMLVGCYVTGMAFSTMFVGMVFKNVDRLEQIPAERRRVWDCMSPRSFLIMAFMIALGITLRHWPAIPRSFIAWFYGGLGTGLSGAGLFYLLISMGTVGETKK